MQIRKCVGSKSKNEPYYYKESGPGCCDNKEPFKYNEVKYCRKLASNYSSKIGSTNVWQVNSKKSNDSYQWMTLDLKENMYCQV